MESNKNKDSIDFGSPPYSVLNADWSEFHAIEDSYSLNAPVSERISELEVAETTA